MIPGAVCKMLMWVNFVAIIDIILYTYYKIVPNLIVFFNVFVDFYLV